MKLVIGLGNPGKEYKETRHNIGFMVIDNYLGKNIKYKKKFNALYVEKIINNEKILFIKPETYMNNSGDSIKQFVDYYHVPIENILIIHDDIDIKLGSLRIKKNSSSGGHNGIKSIINSLNTDEFLRLKIGISAEHSNTVEFVLNKFSKEQKEELVSVIGQTKEIIDDSFILSFDELCNKYN